MTFIEDAEKALDPSTTLFRTTASRLEALLRQAITEVRERDELIAKLREAVRAVLDDACPAEQGDETLVKSHLVSDLRAALTESKG